MKKTIEIDEVCKSCNGTGLYVGMAEGNGSAVVCNTCKGTGCHHFKHTYESFVSRSKISGIKRVFEVNPGIKIGESETLSLSDFGGIDFDAWDNGGIFKKGSENRNYTCPAWWFQLSNYKLKPTWDECISFGSFHSCENFKTKDSCWKRFDLETSNI